MEEKDQKEKDCCVEEGEVNTLDLSHMLTGEKDFNDSIVDILNTTNTAGKKSWVSLSDNDFEAISTPKLTNLEVLTNIVSLNLSNNSISHISPDFFQKLSSGLLFLDLSHNELPAVPEGISSLKSLKELNLSFNLIESIPFWVSTLAPHIEDIKIIGNPLRSLPHSDSLLLRTGPQCFPLTTYEILQHAASLRAPGEWKSGCVVSIGNDQSLKTALLRTLTSNKAIEEPTPLSPFLATRITVGSALSPLQDLTIYDMRSDAVDSVPPLPCLFLSSKSCVVLAVCSCSEVKKELTAEAVAAMANKVLRPLLTTEGHPPRIVLVLDALPQDLDNEWVGSNVLPLLCVRPYSHLVWNGTKSARKESADSLGLLVREALLNEMEWRNGVLGCVDALSFFVRRMRIEKSFVSGKELRDWARQCCIEEDYIPTAISTLWKSGEIFLFSNNDNYDSSKNTFANYDNVDVFLSPGLLADVVLTLRHALSRKKMDAIMRRSDLLTFWRRADIPVTPGLLQAWERLGVIFCGREREPGADVWTLLPWAENSVVVNTRWPAHVPKSVQHFQRVFKISAEATDCEEAKESVLLRVFKRAALLAAELAPSVSPTWKQHQQNPGPAVSATFSTITDSVVLCWADDISALISLEKIPGDSAAEIVLSLRCLETVPQKEVASRLRALNTAVVLGIAISSGDQNGVSLVRVGFVCPHCLSVRNEFFSRTEFAASAVCSAADIEAESSKGSTDPSEKASAALKCNSFSAVPPIKLSEIAPDIVAMTRDERKLFLADLAATTPVIPHLSALLDNAIASMLQGSRPSGQADREEEEFYLGLLRAYPVTLDGQIPIQLPSTHRQGSLVKVTCATPTSPGTFAMGTESGHVITWSEAKSSFVGCWRVCCQYGTVTGLAYWGGYLWVATRELLGAGFVRVWSPVHQRCLCTLYAPAFFVNAPPLAAPTLLAVVGDSYICAALPHSDPRCNTGALVLWDVRTFGLSYALEVGLGGPSCVHYSASRNALYVGTLGGCVIEYDVANGFREVASFRACVPNPVLSVCETGGRVWCACGPTGLVRAYDLAERTFLSLGFNESATEAQITPDLDHRATVLMPHLLCGRFLCGGNTLGRICLWDTVLMRPHRHRRPLSLHNLATPVVALLPGAMSDTVWVADATSNLSVLAGPTPLELSMPAEVSREVIHANPHHWAFALSCDPLVDGMEKVVFDVRSRLWEFEAENVSGVVREKKQSKLSANQNQLPEFLLPASRSRRLEESAKEGEDGKEDDLPACIAFKKFLRFLMVEYLSDQLCVQKICAAGKGDNATSTLFAGIGQPYNIPEHETMNFISRFDDVVDTAGVLTEMVAYTYGEFFSQLTEDSAYLLAQSVLEIVASASATSDAPHGTPTEFTLEALFFSKQEREPVTLATVNHRVSWTDTDILQKSGLRLENGDKYVFPDVQLPENFPFRRSMEFRAEALKMVKL